MSAGTTKFLFGGIGSMGLTTCLALIALPYLRDEESNSNKELRIVNDSEEQIEILEPQEEEKKEEAKQGEEKSEEDAEEGDQNNDSEGNESGGQTDTGNDQISDSQDDGDQDTSDDEQTQDEDTTVDGEKHETSQDAIPGGAPSSGKTRTIRIKISVNNEKIKKLGEMFRRNLGQLFVLRRGN